MMLVMKSNIGKLFSSGAINHIGKARMIRVKLRAIRQDLIGEPVQLGDVLREPWNVVVVVASSEHTHVMLSLFHEKTSKNSLYLSDIFQHLNSEFEFGIAGPCHRLRIELVLSCHVGL